MKNTKFLPTCFMFFFLIAFPAASMAGVYEAPLSVRAQILKNQQNSDGSWGADEGIKFLYTSEAVNALGGTFLEHGAYLNGISWLENHFSRALDSRSRRVGSIVSHGDDIVSEVIEIEGSQRNSGGWGASAVYEGSPIDTALALLSLGAAGSSNGISAAVDYLAAEQLSGPDQGWALFKETHIDPITTSLVLRALAPLTGSYPTAASASTLAIAALESVITANSSEIEKAQAAFALLSHDVASVKGLLLLDEFAAQSLLPTDTQVSPYTTALVVQAMTLIEKPNQAGSDAVVPFGDAKLQALLNAFLGKNRADAIRLGDLAQLTSLDLRGTGIKSLVGLEGATNLTDISVEIDQGEYLGTDADNLYAALLEELNTLSGNLNNVNLYFDGSVDDSDDGVEITVAMEIYIEGETRALDLNGVNIQQGIEPVVTLAGIQLQVLSFNDISGDDDQVIVVLPEGQLNGTYNLVLTNSLGTSKFDVKLETQDLHDGSSWELKTAAAAFGKRRYFGVTVFNNEMWVIGGHAFPNTKNNDVWHSADGVNWSEAVPATSIWEGREHPGVATFNGELWVIGGKNASGDRLGDIWHTPDGVNWTEVTTPIPFAERSEHKVVVYDDKIWVISGINSGGYLGDVWSSSDGVTWTEANPGNPVPWSPKLGFEILAYDGKIWMIGGANANNDIWSSTDGNTWIQETQTADYSQRYFHAAVVYNGLMWAIGGVANTNTEYFSESWTSADGVSWSLAGTAPWEGRYGHKALVFANKIWVFAGISLSWYEDVWVTTPSP